MLLVPFLYVVYARTGLTLSAQTVVAHATSLGVAFVTSTVGSWRYARAHAIAWAPALCYALPGILSAFATARFLARVEGVQWVRAAFGAFLLVAGWDMARRARAQPAEGQQGIPTTAWIWLAGIGVVGGGLSALLGIGGGLIAVPALMYVGRLPTRAVAPTALAGVCITTLSGGLGYLTASMAPPVSEWMAGFVDLRMALPLSLGAVCTVPIGVRVNRRSSPPTLYRLFAGIFVVIGLSIVWSWARATG